MKKISTFLNKELSVFETISFSLLFILVLGGFAIGNSNIYNKTLSKLTQQSPLASYGTPCTSLKITLSWAQNPETDLTKYVVGFGQESGEYDTQIDVAYPNTKVVLTVEPDVKYYFAVKAVNREGLDGEWSDEITAIFSCPDDGATIQIPVDTSKDNGAVPPIATSTKSISDPKEGQLVSGLCPPGYELKTLYSTDLQNWFLLPNAPRYSNNPDGSVTYSLNQILDYLYPPPAQRPTKFFIRTACYPVAQSSMKGNVNGFLSAESTVYPVEKGTLSASTISGNMFVDTKEPYIAKFDSTFEGVQPGYAQQFVVTEKTILSDIEVLMGAMTKGNHSFNIVIYKDRNALPDKSNALYIKKHSYTTKENRSFTQERETNLNWTLDPGTYWVAFEVRNTDVSNGLVVPKVDKNGNSALLKDKITTNPEYVNDKTSLSVKLYKKPVPQVITYLLSTSKAGTGTGTISGVTSTLQNFQQGTKVTLTATAGTDSTFVGWSGACTGTSSTCTVTMDAAKNVIASFNKNMQVSCVVSNTQVGPGSKVKITTTIKDAQTPYLLKWIGQSSTMKGFDKTKKDQTITFSKAGTFTLKLNVTDGNKQSYTVTCPSVKVASKYKVITLNDFLVSPLSAGITTYPIIFDTGQPGGSSATYSSTVKGYATKFNLSETKTIEEISLFIKGENSSYYGNKTLTIALYADNNNSVDQSNEIYKTRKLFYLGTTTADWEVFSNLNWTLDPGTYWVAFETRENGIGVDDDDITTGIGFVGTPNASGSYARLYKPTGGNFSYVAQTTGRGVRIYGSTPGASSYFSISTQTNGTGTITKTIGGSQTNETSFAQGTTIILTAQSSQNNVFSSWSGCTSVSGNICTVVLNSDTNVVANFALETLQNNDRVKVINTAVNVRSVPQITNNIPKGQQQIDAIGTIIDGPVITNEGLNNSAIKWWNINYDSGEDGWSGQDNLLKIGHITPQTFTLTAQKNGQGTITRDSSVFSSDTFVEGTTINLTAAASNGYTFTNWSGCTSVSGNICTVVLNSDTNVVANFNQEQSGFPVPTGLKVSYIENNTKAKIDWDDVYNSYLIRAKNNTTASQNTKKYGTFDFSDYTEDNSWTLSNILPANSYSFWVHSGISISAGNHGTSTLITFTTPQDPGSEDDDNDGIINNNDRCQNTPTNLSSFVNNKGCIKPKMNGFDIKKNIDNEDLTSVSNFEIGKTSKAKIIFNQPINLSSSSQIDLDSIITIEEKKVKVDSTTLAALNVPATITFYNVNSQPKVKRNGVIFDVQGIYNQTAKTFTFTVSGFSEYTIEEDPTIINYTLTTSKSGEGTGTLKINDVEATTGSFAANSIVTLTATAGTDSTFVGWSGACTGTSSTCTVTMDAAKNVIASFNKNSTTSGGGGGGGGGGSSSSTKTKTTGKTAVFESMCNVSNTKVGPGSSVSLDISVKNAVSAYTFKWSGSTTKLKGFDKKQEDQTFTVPNTKGTYTLTFEAKDKNNKKAKIKCPSIKVDKKYATQQAPTQSSSQTQQTTTLSITKTLAPGITDEQVKVLQKILNTKGYIIATKGLGSVGNESSYYGELTKQAVMRFQKANNLPADGWVGERTLSILNK